MGFLFLIKTLEIIPKWYTETPTYEEWLPNRPQVPIDMLSWRRLQPDA